MLWSRAEIASGIFLPRPKAVFIILFKNIQKCPETRKTSILSMPITSFMCCDGAGRPTAWIFNGFS